VKKGYRIDIAKWMCYQRLGLCKDLREKSVNDIKCATC